jgi:hypothetical protein
MSETKPKRYQCRHIFTDGHRCGSICLRGEEFCYYHHTTRKPVQNPRARRGRQSTFDLPVTDPNDRTALQSTIVEVLRRIAANDIDPRRAGLLLYGLQIASLNLPKPQTAQRGRKIEEPETIEEITTHPELGILAPKTDIDEIPINPKSAIGLLLEGMSRKPREEHTTKAPEQTPVTPQPTTLPTIQGTADAAGDPPPNELRAGGPHLKAVTKSAVPYPDFEMWAFVRKLESVTATSASSATL